MKKRLRKKHGIGEFYQPWFTFEAELKPMADPDQADFVARFIAEAEKRDLLCDGAISAADISVAIDTGRLATRNAERRQEFLDVVGKWEVFTHIDASELH